MRIEDAVEWTLRENGSLNRPQITSLVYAFPYLSYSPSGKNEVAALIGSLFMENRSKFLFCSYSNKWMLSKLQEERTSTSPVLIPERAPEVYGHGDESVYLIYAPLERYRAVQVNESMPFAMKIGRTKRRSSFRLQELQTGNHQKLRVGIEFRTDNSSKLESYLHMNLLKHQITESKSSKEWFYSSFEEVLELYKGFKSQELN
jgi:hypothetical protein